MKNVGLDNYREAFFPFSLSGIFHNDFQHPVRERMCNYCIYLWIRLYMKVARATMMKTYLLLKEK